MPDEEAPTGFSEVAKVRRRRYLEARKAGMSLAEAKLFADSEISVSELRRLVEAKCPPELLAGIVL